MIRCLSLALCGALSCLVVGCSSAGMTFDAKSLALKAAPDNFYVVDEDAQIYRSAQPDEESFPELKRVGIRSVLNLRQGFKDSVKYKEAFDGIREYECGVNAGMMKQADLVRALKIIKEAPRPLLIHCLHGSDRTGTVVAATGPDSLKGKVRIGSDIWSARSDEPIEAGAEVVVVHAEGVHVKVERSGERLP